MLSQILCSQSNSLLSILYEKPGTLNALDLPASMYDLSRSGSLCFTNWPATIKIKTGINICINECHTCKKKNMHVYHKNLTLSPEKSSNNNGPHQLHTMVF